MTTYFTTETNHERNEFCIKFYTDNPQKFSAVKDIAEKCVNDEPLSLQARVAALERKEKMRDIREKTMSLFTQMHYGKLRDSIDKDELTYYKRQLNAIFGMKDYTDTDEVRRGEDV